MLDFVNAGKGVVVVHAASYPFSDAPNLDLSEGRGGLLELPWVEYRKMVGGYWSRKDPRITCLGNHHSFVVNGHTVTYDGSGAMCFRVDTKGQLIAFAGDQTNRIAVDDREAVFASRPVARIAWAPSRRSSVCRAELFCCCRREAAAR